MPRQAVVIAVAVLIASISPAAAAAAGWMRPVAGPVDRPFSYGADPFRRGWHRGVDLLARPGARVRAACSGRVAVAGHVPGAGGVVTLRCGRWRVTELPLAHIAVRPGSAVAAGAPVGTLATSGDHDGLHLGVRRAADRFGYVDPMPFLGGDRPRGVPSLPFSRRGPPAVPVARHLDGPRSGPLPAARAAPARAPAGLPLAPWPAWAGLALALAGTGARLRLGRIRVREQRSREAAVAADSP